MMGSLTYGRRTAALLMIVQWMAVWSSAWAVDPTAMKRCELQRAFKLLGYTCAKLDLRDVPQYLSADVEILDLSFNRIRELSPQSFDKYEDIRFLYLFDNMIQIIEANTFSRMRGLEAIDLSTNGLTTIPKELFDLPVLRNLYMSNNILHHLTYDLTLISKPIRAPLQVISMSKCKLNSVPDFGPLPDLVHLNVSYNELTNISTEMFAPFCSLHLADLNATGTPRCMCLEVMQYLQRHNVNIIGDVQCDSQRPRDALDGLTYCTESATPEPFVEPSTFGECSAIVKTRILKAQSRWTWLSILGGLVGFLVAFMAALYVLHRRNVKAARLSKAAAKNRALSSGQPVAVLKLDVVGDGNATEGLLTTKV